MKELLITKTNAAIIDDFGPELAEIYKYDFARKPWYENSKCVSEACPVQYSEQMPLNACTGCGEPMCEAYETDELTSGWSAIVKDQEGMMQLTVNDANIPLRATISRPTNPQELYERKYTDISEMEPWLNDGLPNDLVWIEDTFANVALKGNEKGNLRNRAQTLGLIALQYGGLMIATRTRVPAIVRATTRDMPNSTSVYIGRSCEVEAEQARGAKLIDVVPDERTFLKIDNVGGVR